MRVATSDITSLDNINRVQLGADYFNRILDCLFAMDIAINNQLQLQDTTNI